MYALFYTSDTTLGIDRPEISAVGVTINFRICGAGDALTPMGSKFDVWGLSVCEMLVRRGHRNLQHNGLTVRLIGEAMSFSGIDEKGVALAHNERSFVCVKASVSLHK